MIVLGSLSAPKLAAVKEAFELAFPAQSIDVVGKSTESGVADQPMNAASTRLGAINRATAAQRDCPEGLFHVGIEGGIEMEEDGEWYCFAYVCVTRKDSNDRGISRSGSFQVPKSVMDLVRDGAELGPACDQVYESKEGKGLGGLVGIVTGGKITRMQFYREAVLLALCKFTDPLSISVEKELSEDL
ncbi:unnamed protein product [Chrysoparadoxa australica]